MSSPRQTLGWLMLVGLVVNCSCGGCTRGPRQAMSRWWESVPQVHWTGSRSESPTKTDDAEPTVAANVAVAKEGDLESKPDSSRKSKNASFTQSKATPDPVETASGASTFKPDLVASDGTPQPNRGTPADHVNSLVADPGPSDVPEQPGNPHDKIERLRAALDEDIERGRENSGTNGGADNVRVRVDSLLERSRRLFDVGRLWDARQSAQLAQDLADTAQLDYSPDEERPVDLVNRIDDQLQTSAADAGVDAAKTSEETDPKPPASTAPVADSAPATDPAPAAGLAPTEDPTAGPIQTGSAAEGIANEQSSRLRARRNWNYGMEFFRRDRRPAPTEPSDEGTTTNSVQPEVQLSFDTVDDAGKEDSTSAVVQANRGVIFASTDSASNEQPSSGEGPRRKLGWKRSSSGTIHDSQDPPGQQASASPAAESGASHEDPRVPVELPSEEMVGVDETHRIAVEEAAPRPPEFEEVRPVSASHEVKPHATSGRVISEWDDRTGYSHWGWFAGAAGFVICGLLAWAAYRWGTMRTPG